MGIFSAMQTAVSGMQAQAFALDNISGNIANAQTVGYKRVDTSFEDMVPDLGIDSVMPGGVGASSRSTNGLAGAFQSTNNPTNLAISGSGYFAVSQKMSGGGTLPTFSDMTYYTRRGDFNLDSNNNLVNGAGYYLMGTSIDPVTGVSKTGTPTTIQIPTQDMAPKASTTITYQGNLPYSPLNETSGNGLRPVSVAGDSVTQANESTFLSQSIDGGSVTIYDSSGNAGAFQTRWAKTADGKWDLYYQSNSKATGNGAKWTSLGDVADFNASGILTSTPLISANMTIDGRSFSGITIDLTGSTQYGSSTQTGYHSTKLSTDGYQSASLSSVEISEQGRVSAKYTNGKLVAVADISIANFKGENSLKRLDGGVFESTQASGQPIYNMNNKNILVGGLEASNADISQEFTRMIATQQAYSANSKVITAAQEMMTEAVNVIR